MSTVVPPKLYLWISVVVTNGGKSPRGCIRDSSGLMNPTVCTEEVTDRRKDRGLEDEEWNVNIRPL